MEEIMNKTIMSILALSVLVFTEPIGFASDREGHFPSGAQILAAGPGNDVLVTRPAGEGWRMKEVLGTVVSINEDKREIILNEDYSHLDTPIKLHAEDLPRVKVGDEVKVILQHHTNVAYSVIIVKERRLEPDKRD
jgi:hypothetical protein